MNEIPATYALTRDRKVVQLSLHRTESLDGERLSYGQQLGAGDHNPDKLVQPGPPAKVLPFER